MYKTKRNKDIRIRLDAIKNADKFAKATFIALRNDDSCWHRFLRFFRIIKKQSI